jgi:muramoyltetrapeptide carboxypeptidase
MRPPELHHGDTVSVIAPSGKVNREDVKRASKILKDWGLTIKLARHLYSEHHQFSGTDEQRLDDLQEALDDSSTKAVICARGGYGLTRIVDHLDLIKFRRHPKWVVGYSDVTTLHYLIAGQGIESIHSIMPSQMGLEGSDLAMQTLQDLLFGGEMTPIRTDSRFNRDGVATGLLVGGNVSLIENMLGTQTALDHSGKSLFIEDVGEYMYRLDRMLVHLERAGVFNQISGLVVGSFTSMKNGSIPFGEEPYDMIFRICKKYEVPMLFGAPIGHSLENQAVPVGRLCSLEVKGGTGKLNELVK